MPNVLNSETTAGTDLQSTRPPVGPSDSSDSASDVAGSPLEDTDSDATGTGERVSVDPLEAPAEAETGVDRVVDAGQVGLGGGLDQAEEARTGVRDDESEEST
jgi:hypothetical protein